MQIAVWQFLITILSMIASAAFVGCGSDDSGGGAGGANSYSCVGINSNSTSPLGTNLSEWSYFNDSDWMVVDAFSKASPWFQFSPSLGWENGSITSYDSSGWPTGVTGDTIPWVFLFNNIGGSYPTGTYVIYWEGSGGQIAVNSDASNLRCIDGQPITSCPGGKGLFDVNATSEDGISIQIIPDNAATYNGANYINNIRVIMPGGVCGYSATNLSPFEYCASSRGGSGSCGSGKTCFDFDEVHWNRFSDNLSEIHNPKIVFHPLSLSKLRQYRTIRFMDWLRMQDTTVSNWADRTLVTDYTLAGAQGVPPEYIPPFANLLQANAWINIPHLATNDYNDQFAAWVLANLNSNLQVFIEYTNEHWNPVTSEYPQSAYMLSQAQALSIGMGQPDNTRKSMYYAQRAAQIFDRWTAAFGINSDRVTRVLGGWAGVPSTATTMLGVSGVLGKTDAIAIGPYFGIYVAFAENESTVENWNVDTLMNELFYGGLGSSDAPNGAIAQVTGYIDEYTAITSANGLDLLAYEGGEHLWDGATESNVAMKQLFEGAVLDDRLMDIYSQILGHWRDVGGQDFMHFIHMMPWRFSQFGTYPNHSATCDDFPKAKALNQFISENACWWPNCTL